MGSVRVSTLGHSLATQMLAGSATTQTKSNQQVYQLTNQPTNNMRRRSRNLLGTLLLLLLITLVEEWRLVAGQDQDDHNNLQPPNDELLSLLSSVNEPPRPNSHSHNENNNNDDNDLSQQLEAITNRLHSFRDAVARLDMISHGIDMISQDLTTNLEPTVERLQSARRTVWNLVETINTLQVQQLAGKIKEIQTLARQHQRASQRAAARLSSATGGGGGGGVTLEQWEATLDETIVLADTEATLETWLVETMQDEANRVQQEIVDNFTVYHDTLLTQTHQAVHNATLSIASSSSSSSCVAPSVAAQLVQDAVIQYQRYQGASRYDHAQHARIVHEHTSPTYRPPPQPSQQLGAWRPWIPDDWEQYWLPHGWETWEVRWPPFLTHTLGKQYSLEPSGSAAAPPEMVLHPMMVPGACWPMQGRYGHLVLELAYPVQIDAISIEHAPASLFLDPETTMTSAPKEIKVYGYPACGGGGGGGGRSDPGCHGYYSSKANRILLTTIAYDLSAGGIQTFSTETIHQNKQKKSDTSLLDEDTAASSCSAETGSCSAAAFLAEQPSSNDESVAFGAVDLEILDNWGHPDYTCIYRVRVHGEVATTVYD